MQNQTQNLSDLGDASSHVENGKSHAQQAMDDLAAAGTAQVEDLKGVAIAQIDAVRERAKCIQTNSAAFVRNRPVSAILAAVSAGFVLALLFRR